MLPVTRFASNNPFRNPAPPSPTAPIVPDYRDPAHPQAPNGDLEVQSASTSRKWTRSSIVNAVLIALVCILAVVAAIVLGWVLSKRIGKHGKPVTAGNSTAVQSYTTTVNTTVQETNVHLVTGTSWITSIPTSTLFTSTPTPTPTPTPSSTTAMSTVPFDAPVRPTSGTLSSSPAPTSSVTSPPFEDDSNNKGTGCLQVGSFGGKSECEDHCSPEPGKKKSCEARIGRWICLRCDT